MSTKLDVRRIAIFLLIAFAISWITALILYLTGGIANNPNAVVIIVVFYMSSPAVANIVTRLLTREGWSNLYLRPRLRQGWRYGLICWVAPAIFTIVGMAVFFILFPQYFDPALGTAKRLLGAQAATVNPWVVVLSQTVVGILISPLVNGIPTFGEEFGWRAYLLPKLMPLGGRRAMLVQGVIWGVWHWPIIAMGHNYGFSYPGYPWAGMLMMVWFTIVAGTFLGWASLRGGSVWPAVIGHAAINGIAALSFLLIQGQPNPLLGPTPVGLIGSIGFAIAALLIYVSPRALRQPNEPGPQPPAASPAG